MSLNKKIVIVDDHELFVQGLEGLVNRVPHFEVIYTASDGLDLMEKLPKLPLPDLILLDINMAPVDGFETAQWLAKVYPKIPFLALSMHDDEKSIIQMLRHGAKGYLLKGCKPAELSMAMEQVTQHGFYYSQLTTNALLSQDAESPKVIPRTEQEPLSDREYQFIQLCATDQNYGEIAAAMFVSARTIENYRESVSRKFGVKTRVGIVLEGIRRGIISL